MTDAENLWNLANSATIERKKQVKEKEERNLAFAQTHLTWLIERIMRPAAEKGNFSISDYDLPTSQDVDAFKRVCAERGFDARNRGTVFTIIWAKKE